MLHGFRVLTADGDPQTAQLCRAFLSRQGADVRIALLGQTALALVRPTWVPHALVTAVRLPDMQGDELARAVARRAGHRVLVIGMVEAARARRNPGDSAGPYARRLVKPLELGQLAEVVHAGLHAPHLAPGGRPGSHPCDDAPAQRYPARLPTQRR
jgi:DNA-binding NtrC family response regulator